MNDWKNQLSKEQPKLFKSGDIVFYKSCFNSPSALGPPTIFKGFGIGLFLGHVAPTERAPEAEDAIRLMGACGFVSFDDISEFLSEEQMETCRKKFEEKYWAGQDLTPGVVGPDGKPVEIQKA